MSIKHFKVLQAVLSQTCDVICKQEGLSRSQAFEKAEAFIKENSERWRLPDPEINYEDPFCRMAYLYMNVAIHASLVERAISSSADVENLIRQKVDAGQEIHICALGGGPGSELLGLARFIEGLKLTYGAVHLDFVLVDRVKEWDESWSALKQGVDEQLRSEYGNSRNRWPIVISRSFLPLDVTSAGDFEHFVTRFNGTDLFLCSYLVSELKAYKSQFAQVLGLLVWRASSGALLLFIDRDEREVRDRIHETVIGIESLTLLRESHERGRLQDDLSDLGEWYINIPSLPRQNWLSYFALAKKA